MLMTLGLLAIGATVAIHAEESRDLDEPAVAALLANLASAVEDRTGSAPAVQPYDATMPCAESCVLEIAARAGARELVSVRILAVPSKIRVIAELRDRDLRVLRRAQVDLAHEQAQWPSSLEAVALALFPMTARQQNSSGEPRAKRGLDLDPRADVVSNDDDASRRWPWWLVGGGALAGGVAIVLGVENKNARDEGTQPGVSPARVEELRDVTHATGLGANVLFGVAATSLITGAILLIAD